MGLRKKLRTHIESVEELNPEARDAQSAELERIQRLELQRSISSFPEDEEGEEGGGDGEGDESVMKETKCQDQSFIGTSVSVEEGVQGSSIEGSLNIEGSSALNRSSSPEVLQVSEGAGPRVAGQQQEASVEPIVIDSGSSDSDPANYQKPHPPPPPRPHPVLAPRPQATPPGHVGTGGRRAVQTQQRQFHGKYDMFTPRSDGRVLVNEGHTPSEADVFLAPQIAAIVKPHQVRTCVRCSCVRGKSL